MITIQYVPGIGDARHRMEDGLVTEAYADPAGRASYVLLREIGDAAPAHYKADQGITPFLRETGWPPADGASWADGQERVWPGHAFRYWFCYPADLKERMRMFVRAPLAGTLPSTWAEREAEDSDGNVHVVATVNASFAMARAWGEIQPIAEGELAQKVTWYQTITDELYDLDALTLHSRQPSDTGGDANYSEGTLYQTGDSAAADRRGKAWAEQDVLNVCGLTLL